MSRSSSYVIGIAITALVALVVFFSLSGGTEVGTEANEQPEIESPETRPGYVKIGGVWRPEKDVVKSSRRLSDESSDFPKPVQGRSPVVSTKDSASVSSIAGAVNDPELLKKRTAFGSAEKFNKKKYLDDPDAYLADIVPGRVWQVLAAGKEVPRIEVDGSNYAKLIQGESAILKAKTDPGMPVTFYSDKLGQFQNNLNVISVAAGDDGIAEATFKATGGTRGQINIIAASPVRSGHAKFLIKVTLPLKK